MNQVTIGILLFLVNLGVLAVLFVTARKYCYLEDGTRTTTENIKERANDDRQ